MEPSILYQLLVEIKGDVGEIKGTIRAVAEAAEDRDRRLADHEVRLETLEVHQKTLQVSSEAVQVYKGRMIALASGIAGAVASVVAFAVNAVPYLWSHFTP